MSLSIIPKEVLLTISCYIAINDPKDLVQFGKVSKLTNEIVNNNIFKKLLEIFKEARRNLKNAYTGRILAAKQMLSSLNANAEKNLATKKMPLEKIDDPRQMLFELIDDSARKESLKTYFESVKAHEQPSIKTNEGLQNEINKIRDLLNNRK